MNRLLPLAVLAMMAGCGGGPTTHVTVLVTYFNDAPASTSVLAGAPVTVHALPVLGLGAPIAARKTDTGGRADFDLTAGSYVFCQGNGPRACAIIAVPAQDGVFLLGYEGGFTQMWSAGTPYKGG